MNLYLVSQSVNTEYDTYDSFVVVAPDEEYARHTHPRLTTEDKMDGFWWNSTWTSELDKVEVKLIGTAAKHLVKGQVICASFNAG